MTAERVLEVAKKEIGTKENPKGSNIQKYGKEYGINGVAWCCIFVWWVFSHAGASKLFANGAKYASCTLLIKAMHGQFHEGYIGMRPGDIVFFDFDKVKDADHVGICEKLYAPFVDSIDGNTGSGNEANGGCVMRRTRNVEKVYGYIRPAYTVEKKPSVPKNTIKKGAKGTNVGQLQECLNYLEMTDSHGKPLAVDKSFGAKTYQAVMKFQRKCGMEDDGSYGPLTYKRMLAEMTR